MLEKFSVDGDRELNLTTDNCTVCDDLKNAKDNTISDTIVELRDVNSAVIFVVMRCACAALLFRTYR